MRQRPPMQALCSCEDRLHYKRCCYNDLEVCEVPRPPQIRSLLPIRKSRLRRNASSAAESTQRQPTASPSEAPGRESLSSQHHSSCTPDSSGQPSQVGVLWNPNPPATLSRNGSQTSPSLAHQSIRSNSNLPSFDSDSALAITRKVFILES